MVSGSGGTAEIFDDVDTSAASGTACSTTTLDAFAPAAHSSPTPAFMAMHPAPSTAWWHERWKA